VFVRSIDHDSFKEHEALALGNGGNEIVNRIYEALLSGDEFKPTSSSLVERKGSVPACIDIPLVSNQLYSPT